MRLHLGAAIDQHSSSTSADLGGEAPDDTRQAVRDEAVHTKRSLQSDQAAGSSLFLRAIFQWWLGSGPARIVFASKVTFDGVKVLEHKPCGNLDETAPTKSRTGHPVRLFSSAIS